MAFEGQAPAFLHKDGDEVDIFVRYDEPWRTPDSLLKLQIPNKFARFVALNQVANFSEENENAEIRSENGLYAVKVLDTMQNVNVLSNNAFSILSKIEKQFANKTNQLAAAPYFENEKEETAKSMKEIGIAVALGLVLIFGLLIFSV